MGFEQDIGNFFGGVGNFFSGMDPSKWWGDRNASSIGGGPNDPGGKYFPQWDSLLSQLDARARGNGPSVAENAYRAASDKGMRQQQTLAAGGTAGGALRAADNMGRITQGLSQGASNARLQEQMAYQQALQNALGTVSQQDMMRRMANLQAMTNTPTKGQQVTDFLGKLLPVLAGGGR